MSRAMPRSLISWITEPPRRRVLIRPARRSTAACRLAAEVETQMRRASSVVVQDVTHASIAAALVHNVGSVAGVLNAARLVGWRPKIIAPDGPR